MDRQFLKKNIRGERWKEEAIEAQILSEIIKERPIEDYYKKSE